jgi:uncharacterized protein YggE
MRRIALVAVLLLAAAAVAGVARPDGARAVDPADEGGTVTVNGTGTVTSTPDRAQISAGVETRGETARAALQANAAEMRRVIDALRRAGATELQTQYVSLSPRQTENGTVEGYTAQNTVTATVGIARAGAAIDAGVAAGANVVWGPTLSSSDAEKLYRDALTAAVADARTRAEALAAAAGRTVGKVTAMVEGGATAIPLAEKAAMASDAATPIEPGTQDTTATVSVTFALV